MFQCGDKVVYPMYGAGVIDAIEEKSVDGVLEQYYHITIPNGSLKITLSTKKAETVGLRPVTGAKELRQVMQDIAVTSFSFNSNWNQRYKENMEKIKTGRITEVAEVVRRLVLRERERALSGAEKKMLNNAKQIMVSEIAFANQMGKEQAEDLLTELLLAD